MDEWTSLNAGELMFQAAAGHYYLCNAVIVTENHLHFVNGRHIVCKPVGELYKFHEHV